MARGGGALEIIIRTWPEFEKLKHDLETKKGVLVDDNAFAISAMENSLNNFFLADTTTIRQSIFQDYLKEKHGTIAKCCYTFTDKFAFARVPIGLIFPKKKTVLKSLFNHVIQDLVQSGLLYQSMKGNEDDVDLVGVCQGDGGGSEKTLLITDVGSTFVLTVVGCLVALFIFTGEKIWTGFQYLVTLMGRLKEFDRKLKRHRQKINRLDSEVTICEGHKLERF